MLLKEVFQIGNNVEIYYLCLFFFGCLDVKNIFVEINKKKDISRFMDTVWLFVVVFLLLSHTFTVIPWYIISIMYKLYIPWYKLYEHVRTR